MKFPEVFASPLLAELWAAQPELAGKYALIAGGTDILAKSSRLDARRRLIGLSAIAELKGFSKTDEKISFGVLTTMSALANNEIVAAGASALAQAIGQAGSWQIRNRATIGKSGKLIKII